MKPSDAGHDHMSEDEKKAWDIINRAWAGDAVAIRELMDIIEPRNPGEGNL